MKEQPKILVVLMCGCGKHHTYKAMSLLDIEELAPKGWFVARSKRPDCVSCDKCEKKRV